MTPDGAGGKDGASAFLAGLAGPDLLSRPTWEQWLDIAPPFAQTGYAMGGVTARYRRNGFAWDIHATLYTPEAEVDPGLAFVVFHGGAGSERGKDETPDGRPGIARVLAAQGFAVLSITYPGHYPPAGEWAAPIEGRLPIYLLDRDLEAAEIRQRNLCCTFNVIMEGAGRLVDRHLAGRRLLAFGHSTGGPMAADLYRVVDKAKVVGIIGFGSGGPDGWRGRWRDQTGAESAKEQPLDLVASHTAEGFRRAGYEDHGDLTPWGGAEEYTAWGARVRSQIKTGLCFNQHRACRRALEKYPALTGLAAEEYLGHLADPDPEWLASIGVLLLVGENDRGHWLRGERIGDKREMYMAVRYAEHTPRSRLVLVPRYGHFGFAARHNEKIVHAWLWALLNGFFPGVDSEKLSPPER